MPSQHRDPLRLGSATPGSASRVSICDNACHASEREDSVSRPAVPFATLLRFPVVILFGSNIASCKFHLLSCDVVPIRKVDSPSGRLRATVLSKDCGATTRESIGVSIGRSTGPVPDTAATVFSIDNRAGYDSEAAVLRVLTDWMSDSAIVITYDQRATVYRRDTLHEGVRVLYRGVSGVEVHSKEPGSEH